APLRRVTSARGASRRRRGRGWSRLTRDRPLRADGLGPGWAHVHDHPREVTAHDHILAGLVAPPVKARVVRELHHRSVDELDATEIGGPWLPARERQRFDVERDE